MIPLLVASVATLALLPQKTPAAPRERWILRFADGSLHRGLAREAPKGFELLRQGKWELVLERDVAHAVREREALAELQARRRIAGADPERQVDAAAFALGEGLLAESMAVIDGVLETDPDQAAARSFIARAPLSLTLPGGAALSLSERLVLFGARAQPAYRELAAERLRASSPEALAPVLARALASPSHSVRAFGAFASRRTDPRAQVDLLVRRCVVDPVQRVRAECARGLRDARDETLATRVAAALELPDARLRASASEALGVMGYRSAIPALATRLAAFASGSHPGGTRAHIRVGNQVAYVQDFDPEIAQAAAIGDPIVDVVEDATVLDVRVGGTSSQAVEVEGQSLCRALSMLSGEKRPEKPSAWLEWWKRNAGSFRGGFAAPATGD